MKQTKKKADRREFLRSAIQSLIVVPGAGTVEPIPRADNDMLLNDANGPLPGEPGYREQGIYSYREEE